jgi:hypothetical protein
MKYICERALFIHMRWIKWLTGVQLGALTLGVRRALRRDAIAAGVRVRRTLEGACCVAAIGEYSLLMIAEVYFKNTQLLLKV